jgi:hypothetical protein
MPKYFPGITHAHVHTVSSAKLMAAREGTIAHVNLFFGPGDTSCIRLIAIKKINGPTSGVIAEVPMVPLIGETKTVNVPIVAGHAADELKMEALIAFDKVKSSKGLKFDKHYEVIAKEVKEI